MFCAYYRRGGQKGWIKGFKATVRKESQKKEGLWKGL